MRRTQTDFGQLVRVGSFGCTGILMCLFSLILCATACIAGQTTPTVFALYNVPAGKYAVAKRLSLNTVVIWPEKKFLDEAESAGLRAIVNIPPGNFSDSGAWTRRVKELRRHPALFAWVLYDEPDLNRKPVPEVAMYYRLMKSIDKAHPVYQTIWNPRRYADYAPYCDILAVVPYVINRMDPLSETEYQTIQQMVMYGKQLMKGKPVYAVLQSFAGHPAWPRPPTPDELLNMFTVARGAGADGYAFYAYTSNEPYPTPTSTTKFQLTADTPLMNAIRKAALSSSLF